MESKFNLKTILGIVVLVMIILIGSFIGYSRFSVAGMQNRANKLIDAGKYKEAYDIYEKIAIKTGTETAVELKNKASALVKSDEMFKEGKEKLADGDYMAAIKAFSQVIEEDKKNYTTSQKLLEDSSEKIFDDARVYAEDLDFKKSISILEKYMNIVEDDKEAKELYDDILLKQEKEEKLATEEAEKDMEIEIDKIKEEIEANLKLEKETEKSNQSNTTPYMRELADSLIYSTHTIQSSAANVRSGPSTSYPSFTNIKQGATIYIYDTVIDGTDRVWCLGTITATNGRVFDGWASSRNLDGSL